VLSEAIHNTSAWSPLHESSGPHLVDRRQCPEHRDVEANRQWFGMVLPDIVPVATSRTARRGPGEVIRTHGAGSCPYGHPGARARDAGLHRVVQ